MLYQLSISRSTDIVQWDAAKVIETCDKSIAAIKDLMAYNERTRDCISKHPDLTVKLGEKLDQHYYFGWFPKTAKSMVHENIYFRRAWFEGHKATTYQSKTDTCWIRRDDLDTVRRSFQTMVDACEHIKKKVQAGKKIAKSDTLLIIDPYDSPYHCDIAFVVKSVTVPSMVKCQFCNDSIPATRIGAHQQTLRCKTERRRIELRDNDFTAVESGTKLYNLAKAGQCPGAEMVPIRYAAYIPEWVMQAYDVYEKDGKPFANMTLGEYLHKMKPDEPTVPQLASESA